MNRVRLYMINAKSISEEQKGQIQTWADEGVGLPGIQSRLDADLGIKLTYMEMRFLIDDLGITMPEDEKPAPPEDESPEDDETADTSETAEAAEAADGGDDESPDTESTANAEADDDSSESGPVTVTISELERPGAVASGTVTFAGGESADWYLDQMGRLGLDPRNPDYRPSESDMMAFQKELQEEAKKKGL